MQVGSFLAGVAFSHSMVGMVHGIAHALGGVYHIPHGLANALILPEVMAYNLEARIDRYADIALAMGISFPQVIGQSRSLLRSSRLDIFSKIAGLSDVDSLKELVTTSSHQARNKLSTVIGNLGFIDTWVRRQAALAAVEKIRCLNQQLAYLPKMPLNLKDAGISDNLEKLEQVATIAMEDGAMLYNPIEPERDAVIEIIKKVYDAKRPPLPVSKEDLRPLATAQPDTSVTNVFKDAKMLYEILVEFYELLKNHPEIGPKLAQSNLCVQFRYKNPSAVITIDATGDDLKIIQGEFDGQPEVVLTMNADFAHAFWHGKANLVSALTRRQVKAKGNVPKTIKLLPILNPSYALYPKFLADKGLRHLVMT
jgi:putative sterol carrier protein